MPRPKPSAVVEGEDAEQSGSQTVAEQQGDTGRGSTIKKVRTTEDGATVYLSDDGGFIVYE